MGVLARLGREAEYPAGYSAGMAAQLGGNRYPARPCATRRIASPIAHPMSALHLAVVFALIGIADRLAMLLITLRFQASLRIMSIMGNLVRCNIARLTH